MATAATERHYGLSSNAKHAFDVQDTYSVLSKASVCANNDAQHAAWRFSVMSSYNTIAFCVYMHVAKDFYLSISTSRLYSLDFIMHHGFSKYFTMTLSLQDTKITV